MKTYLQKHDKIRYSDDYSTPSEIYDHYVKELNYYDPCPLHSKDFNFLPINQELFINPPYSDIKTWVLYAMNNYVIHNKHVVLLVPSRTDTKWFHDLLMFGVTLEFIKGSLKFGNLKGSAPFPSILIHIGGKF